MDMIGNVNIRYTIGFGNNIFQYVFGRLLAETKGLNLVQNGISPLNVKKTISEKNTLRTISVNDKNAVEIL